MSEDEPITNMPPNHPHAALQMFYAEERREITEAFYIKTKNLTPKEDDKH